MKNILFITSSLGFGGAAKILIFLAESLAKRGYRVGIVNLHNTQAKKSYKRSVSEQIEIFDSQGNGNVATIGEIKAAAKKIGADVIVGFTAYPNMYAKIVGTLLGIPSIMSERGDPTRTAGKSAKARLAYFLVNRSRGGVFQTEGAKALYGRGLQKRGKVIANPIFISGELPDVAYEAREKNVVSVGRLDNFQKRYDVMLKAFKLFSEKHPEYTLKLYGSGMDEDKIKGWAVDEGIADKVRFMGLSKTPLQDIASDGMFLITSDFEGISNSLLEAMALGLPCVSTDHTPGGARMLITDHENGLLAPVGDAEALARAMCEFAEDPTLAKRCGEEARNVLCRFAPEKIVDEWEAYINQIISK